MSLWAAFLREPDESFRPADLSPAASVETLSPSDRTLERWLIVGLAALCLLPRLLLSLRLTAICDDGMYYIYVSDCMDRGNLAPLFQFLSLNIYPPILVGLHRLGLDWFTAGKLWGLVASTLLVFPLYDWVRRMCDRPTALFATLIYAVHPEYIELSIEPTRDTTFFLVLVVSLWALYRAISEQSWRWFFVAGLATTLAVHTRVEAWCLFPAMLLWSARRAWHHPERRSLLIFGNAWCLACIPLFVIAVNLTWLRDQPEWELGRTRDLYTARNLVLKVASSVGLGSFVGVTSDEQLVQPETGEVVAQRHSLGEGAGILVHQFSSGIKWMTMLLLAMGLARWRRSFMDWDFLVLGAVAIGLCGLIVARLMLVNGINGRYFLTPLLCVPFLPAAGLRWWLSRIPRTAFWSRRPLATAVAIVSTVIVAGLVDAALTRHPRRMAERELGKSLQARFRPGSSVIVSVGMVRVGTSFLGECPDVEWNPLDRLKNHSPGEPTPDVLMFRGRAGIPLEPLLERGRELGFVPLPVQELAPIGNPESYLILARPDSLLPRRDGLAATKKTASGAAATDARSIH